MKQFVRQGLDNVAAMDRHLQGLRLGVVAGGASIDSNLQLAVDLLHERYTVIRLFNTIFGIRGEFIYGEHTPHYVDDRTGLPVYSIFSAERNAPSLEMLVDLDAIVFDLREVGVRYYEYLYCLAQVMKSCAAAQLPLFVLDRANPLGGLVCEGTVCGPDMHTFVGDYGLAQRTGLTIGEFAQYVNQEYGLGCPLTIIPCLGWRRSWLLDDTDVPWVLPSPSLPRLESILLYAGMCLLEGIQTLSEGRGTTMPFELLGAPWLPADALVRRMNNRSLEGVRFGRVHYVPRSSKYAGEVCHGVQIHVLDKQRISPVRVAMTLIEEIRELCPDQLQWAPSTVGHDVKPPGSSREFTAYFDMLLGTERFRTEGLTADQLLAYYGEDLERYKKTSQRYYLYD